MTVGTERRKGGGRIVRPGMGLLTLLFIIVLGSCGDVTDVELLEISGSGLLGGQAFLDLDGSGDLSPGDTFIEGVEVLLLASNEAEAVDRATTDSIGAFTIFDVPLGTYRLRIAPAALADSLESLQNGDSVTVDFGDTLSVNIGASYPMVSLSEAKAAPAGTRVFTSGIALNRRLSFGDGQVHLSDGSTYLRTINMDRTSLAPGDSIRVLGRVVIDNGRPALDQGTPYTLVQQAALVVPVDVETGTAADADSGDLDAALVRIQNAEITDTATTVDGDFRFWADDGSDSVEVVIREFLGLTTSTFRPDTIIRIDRMTGLLSPVDDGSGSVRWRVLPRSGGDVFLETKFADVAVAMSLDTATASLGDTVEVTVVASNSGPVDATSLQVRDTIPTALGFISSTASVGSYDAGTGIWDIGDLPAGATDTLRVRMEVTDGTPTTLDLVSESLGLTFEVDPTAGNDRVVVTLTIS